MSSDDKILGNCFIYARVSTREQSEEGSSIETQIEICKEEALKRRLYVVDTFIDRAISGRTFKRAGLTSMLDGLMKGMYIITYSFNRLGRNTKQILDLYDDVRQRGCKIICQKEPHINDDSETGKLIRQILASIYEWEANAAQNRSQAVIKSKDRGGELIKHEGFGFDIYVLNGRKYPYPVAHLQEALTFIIKQWEAEHRTPWKEIAKELTRRGIRPKKAISWTRNCIVGVYETAIKTRKELNQPKYMSEEYASLYEKYKASMRVPRGDITEFIDKSTGYFDYLRYFGNRYDTSSVYAPTIDEMKQDIKNGILVTNPETEKVIMSQGDITKESMDSFKAMTKGMSPEKISQMAKVYFN